MADLSIIFPAYNEAARIPATLRSFDEYLSTKNISYELLVVDDGSTDETVKIVRGLKEQIRTIEILPLKVNRGKGHAIRAGMLGAKGAIRLFSDADGSTPPCEMEKLLEPIASGTADITIGSRYLSGSEIVRLQPLYRRIWSRLSNRIVRSMLLPGIVDPHCGFKAFTATAAGKVFSQCVIDGWSFDLEALTIARRAGFRIAEIPVRWANHERSKGKIRHLPREIRSVYTIRRSLR